MYYKNGSIKYHGYYINDKMEGKGKYIYEYKDCYYVGDFLNDKEHGKGILYYKKDDTIKYEGDWEITLIDEQKNIWFGIRFNVTRIPYVILIENKNGRFNSQSHYSFRSRKTLLYMYNRRSR